ncbi:hypothetical protein [Kribbella soli]|uniref:Uncharacterized protein n=1 Tax=Kribbella soli TaxID=1124743 RepID=A0A4R0HEE0_9ACTN|nr:hypothetical protein [Kribbella soli]TCC08673.1 hypothetical protein E0H45_22750 [Kribbella soli]
MSEPDPNHMTAFGHKHVVTLLREMCGVEAGVALWIGDDILAPAQDFSTLEQSTRMSWSRRSSRRHFT